MLRTLNIVIFNFARKGKPIASIITPDQYSEYSTPLQSMNINKKQIKNSNQSSQQTSSTMFKKQEFQVQKKTKQQLQLKYQKSVQDKIKLSIAKQLSYQGQDPTPNKLVNRPAKGVLWGLGGQLILASKKVQLQGIKDNIQQIVQFLQLNQVKNIYIHDFHKQNPEKPQTNRKRFSIVGSCYSARHCWKTGGQLRNAFNLNSGKTKFRKDKKYDPVFASKTGGKDEEFVMVQFKDFSIILMTQQQRQAMDLQWKWNNEVSDETTDKYMKLKLNKKGRKNTFEDL